MQILFRKLYVSRVGSYYSIQWLDILLFMDEYVYQSRIFIFIVVEIVFCDGEDP